MKVLILSSAFSGLTQRVLRELMALGHEIDQHYDLEENILRSQLARFKPDVVICPFLTQRIPEDVWRNYLCLVVHPGIEGDRGPSSLDWAISNGASEWGVTLLQAVEEMDAGDIWGTQNFPLREAGKTSIYKREVSTTAIDLIKKALKDIESGTFKPRPLDYSNPNVRGQLLPLMRQDVRSIQWQYESTTAIVNKLNAADTNPGVKTFINGVDVHLYGAVREPHLRGMPGEVICVYKGAACFATIDGAVWIRQMKCKDHPNLPAIKLPASVVLNKILPPGQIGFNVTADQCSAVEDIRVERVGDVAYVYFDFYNGAASTEQCVELKNKIIAVKQSDAKFIVFMGGEDFWSNGIHLNCIEAAQRPAHESWLNINAIDDVVREIINCPNQLTIAALRNNAGAGGVVMAMACDEVIIRKGVVLNPHYKSMGLYGSEYWTYLMPKRIGLKQTDRIINGCEPMLSSEAMELGLADLSLPEDWNSYHAGLEKYCSELSKQIDLPSFLDVKAQQRASDEMEKPLEKYREEELVEMKRIFDDPNSEYHYERHAFVHKIKKPRKGEQDDLQAAV